jgi:hypothetical protein
MQDYEFNISLRSSIHNSGSDGDEFCLCDWLRDRKAVFAQLFDVDFDSVPDEGSYFFACLGGYAQTG